MVALLGAFGGATFLPTTMSASSHYPYHIANKYSEYKSSQGNIRTESKDEVRRVPCARGSVIGKQTESLVIQSRFAENGRPSLTFLQN